MLWGEPEHCPTPLFLFHSTVLLAMGITGAAACEELGIEKNAQNIFGNSDTFGALLWASFLGSETAWILSWVQHVRPDGTLTHMFSKGPSKPILSLRKSLEVWTEGMKGLTSALMILMMAWTIGAAFTACGTGERLPG